jgi:hypothetical protein
MAKVKVSTDFKQAKDLAKKLTYKDAQTIGDAVTDEMKRMIAKGISPVKGVGRFKAYAAQRSEAKTNYPVGLPKKTRPVNLFLFGGYLEFIRWWLPSSKSYVGIGFSGETGKKTAIPKKIRDMFETHNEGSQPEVPRRKHLPNEQGDQFARSVDVAYKKAVEKVIDQWVNLMNKQK